MSCVTYIHSLSGGRTVDQAPAAIAASLCAIDFFSLETTPPHGDDTRIGISAGYSGSASNRSCIPYHDALVSQANGHAAETRRYDEE